MEKIKKIPKLVLITILIIIFLLGIFFVFRLINNQNTLTEDYKVETVLSDENVIKDISVKTSKNKKEDKNVIGYLTIDSIELIKAPIKEGIEMSTLNKYIGHFPESAYLEGNIALAGHNRGYEKNYFENLKYIKKGDIIEYQTKSEIKKYKVTEIKKITEFDVDVIKNTKENKITLITCVENKPEKRMCIQGILII